MIRTVGVLEVAVGGDLGAFPVEETHSSFLSEDVWC